MKNVKLYGYFPLLSLFLLLGLADAAAQEKQWTLEECIDYAIEHNIEIKSYELDTQLKEHTLNTSKWSRLPDLNANLGQNFDFGRSPSADNTSIESTSATNSSFNIGTSVPLFTGFRIPNEVAAGKLDLRAAFESLNKAKESLSLQVASNYLNVLFYKELEWVRGVQSDLSAEQVTKTEMLVQAGKVPEGQLFDIKAVLANDYTALVEAQNQTKLMLLALAQNLEMGEQIELFEIAEPVLSDPSQTLLGSLQTPAEIYLLAVTTRPMIKEQELLLESSKKRLEIAKSDYYPKLNFSAYYSNGYYYFFDQANPSFTDQIDKNQRTNLGLSLSIPIFNRFRVRNQVRSSRINIFNRELNLDNSKKALFEEIQKAYYNAIAAQRKYVASKESVGAAAKSFEYAQERYNVGKASVFELNEAKTKMSQSLAEQVQSKYEFIFRVKILDFYRGEKITL